MKNQNKDSKKVSRNKIVVMIVMFLCVLSSVLVPIFISSEKKLDYMNKMNVTLQIISSFFVIAGVFIAVWQYYLNSKSERIKLNKECIQKAIDLSNYYKDNILNNYSVIKYVYENSGITKVLNNINPNQMVQFDEKELNDLLNEAQINELKQIQVSEKFKASVMLADYIFNLNIAEDIAGIEDIDKKKIIQSFVNNIVCTTLNNMEYFALHFTYNTADSDIVYQSLHKTYLEITRTLYYTIAKSNPMNTTRLYTNVISLYNKWNNIYEEQVASITSNNRNTILIGNKVDNLD